MLNNSKQLKNVTVEDITSGFKLGDSLANILKWSLIGLYIQNDKPSIETLESLFSKNGTLQDKRAYKTEAKAVYNKILSGDIKVNNPATGKVMTIAELSDMKAHELKTSVGVLYKSIPKNTDKTPVADKVEKKAAKKLLDDNDGVFNGLKRVSDIVATAKAGIPAFQEAIDDIKAQFALDELKAEFPEVTTDNLPKIVTMSKEYLTELHANFPEEFQQVIDHVMELQADNVAERKVA